jgi:hypothetical protein
MWTQRRRPCVAAPERGGDAALSQRSVCERQVSNCNNSWACRRTGDTASTVALNPSESQERSRCVKRHDTRQSGVCVSPSASTTSWTS